MGIRGPAHSLDDCDDDDDDDDGEVGLRGAAQTLDAADDDDAADDAAENAEDGIPSETAHVLH